MSPSSQCFFDCLLGEGSHDAIARLVRVDAIRGEPGSHAASLVGHRRMVVEIDSAVRRGVILHPLVKRDNLWRGLQPRLPRIIEYGKNRRENYLDAVGA